MSECDSLNSNAMGTKKKRSLGRMSAVSKKLRLSSHAPGKNCECVRLKCFLNVTDHERQQLLKNFNSMKDHHGQNAYLCSLMSIHTVKRRRPRQEEDVAKFHEKSFSYHVKVIRDDGVLQIPICFKAFYAIHGVSKKKIEYLQRSLKETGLAPRDKRGLHTNRPRKIPDEIISKVLQHIGSFKGRASHYSFEKTKKIYLSEELNLAKMHHLYKEAYPQYPISYEKYRIIFNTKFNISFGYPRSDTCSICDEYLAKIKVLEKRVQSNETNTRKVEDEKKWLQIENDVHKKKAETFYTRKREAREKSQTSNLYEAICVDFQKNLPLPNISTNDVYYKRQLSMYTFNIHILSTGRSIFFMYPQTVAKKGADEVVSMLHSFITTVLDPRVRHLDIFCDSCPGQNKNYTVFRYVHYAVHQLGRLDSIKITFPIRGHSYLECDRNMGLINQKIRAEVPSHWYDVFRGARVKPSPFEVIEVEQDLIRSWTSFLQTYYKKKCPLATRDVKEISASKEHPQFLTYRNTYNGHHETATVTLQNYKALVKMETSNLKPGEFLYPRKSYDGKSPLPIYRLIDQSVI